MGRLLLVATLVVGFGASAAEDAPAAPKVKRHRWKCTFVGRMVYCDRVDSPLQASLRKERLTLQARTPPDFAPLVTAPASFR